MERGMQCPNWKLLGSHCLLQPFEVWGIKSDVSPKHHRYDRGEQTQILTKAKFLFFVLMVSRIINYFVVIAF
jgi:hypothetical protein